MKLTSGEGLEPQETFNEGDKVFVVDLDAVWTDKMVEVWLATGRDQAHFEVDLQRMHQTLDAVGVGINSVGVVKDAFTDGYYQVEFVNERLPQGFSLHLPDKMLSKSPVEDERLVEE